MSLRQGGGIAARRPKQGTPVAGRAGHVVINRAALDSPAATDVKTLKEWSVVIGALRDGEQTVLMRKGGIKEQTFKPAAEFLLFPTAFHVAEDVLKEGIAARYAQEMMFDPKKETTLHLQVYAKVTGAWTTKDTSVIRAMSHLHIGTDSFMEAKLKWRGAQPLTIMELRTYILPKPVSIPVEDSLFGCFSWLDLPVKNQVSWDEAKACISESEFQLRQQHLREILGDAEVQELQI